MNADGVRQLAGAHAIIRHVDQLSTGPIRIETAFLYPEGSSIDVFVVQDERTRGAFKLSDLGQTHAWLLDVQVKPWLSKKRQALLEDAIRTYGVEQKGGALEIPLSSIDELPSKVILLGQACLRVADLVFTKRSTFQVPFMEEVEEVLADSDLSYERDVELPGLFGQVRVDFLVQGARTRSAVLTLASTSSSSAHIMANEIFRRWHDLASIRDQGAGRVTIYDDSKDVYRDDDIRRLDRISNVIRFSDRQAVRDVLAA